MRPMLDNRPQLPTEIARRRTFAIISHPDAGKTTLTEKFLLFGGAIQMAGQVRAKGDARRTRSDFMKLEQERGISVSASAMSFDFRHYRFNLVDTPGHSDFSEDTYRTLTAVDSAIWGSGSVLKSGRSLERIGAACGAAAVPLAPPRMDRKAVPPAAMRAGTDMLRALALQHGSAIGEAEGIEQRHGAGVLHPGLAQPTHLLAGIGRHAATSAARRRGAVARGSSG